MPTMGVGSFLKIRLFLNTGNVGDHRRLHGSVQLSAKLVLMGTNLRSKSPVHLPPMFACPPPTYVPPPAAFFPGLVPPQGHLQGLQLLWERVRTEARGSTGQGVRVRGAPNAAPAVPPGALRLRGGSSKASSQQSRHLEGGESLRSCRSPESPLIGCARCVGPPLRTTAGHVASCLRHPPL